MKISSFYFGPGSPKKTIFMIFLIFFTKKWAGIRESRVRRRAPGNHEWDDGHQGVLLEVTKASHSRLPGRPAIHRHQGARRLTRGYQSARRLTRDSGIVVSLVIPIFQPIFS